MSGRCVSNKNVGMSTSGISMAGYGLMITISTQMRMGEARSCICIVARGGAQGWIKCGVRAGRDSVRDLSLGGSIACNACPTSVNRGVFHYNFATHNGNRKWKLWKSSMQFGNGNRCVCGLWGMFHDDNNDSRRRPCHVSKPPTKKPAADPKCIIRMQKFP